MKYFTIRLLLLGLIFSAARTEAETIDLKALAEQARPAVVLVLVRDAGGKAIQEGTGFLISKDGKLVTNCHVLRHGQQAEVKVASGQTYVVNNILAYDEEQDLALVQTEARDLPFLKFSAGDKAIMGRPVAIVSAPVKPGDNMTTGTVSSVFALGEYGWLSIAAKLWEGSSGSPVLDAKGEVVGIVMGTDETRLVGLARSIAGIESLLAREVTPVTVASYSKASTTEKELWSSLGLHKATLAFVKGNFSEALKGLDKLAEEFPQSALINVMRGCALVRLQAYGQAVAACEQAVKQRPQWAFGWASLGMVHADQRHWAEAIPALQEAVRLKSTDPKVWRTLGISLDKRKESEKALEVYEQAVKLFPKEAGTWALLADAYCRFGKPAEGITAYQRALENNVVYPEGVWLNMGQTYLTLHQYADALKAWQRVTALNPKFANQVADSIEIESALAENNPATWIHLAVIHTGVGHPAKAKTAYLRLEKLDLKKAQELAKDLPGLTK